MIYGQFTTGPWSVSRDTAIVIGHDGKEVASTANRYRSAPTIEANARMCAASTELFAFLKRFATFAADNGWTDEEFHDSDGTGWISGTLAVLAKVEGPQ